jgi:hypothetical protein
MRGEFDDFSFGNGMDRLDDDGKRCSFSLGCRPARSLDPVWECGTGGEEMNHMAHVFMRDWPVLIVVALVLALAPIMDEEMEWSAVAGVFCAWGIFAVFVAALALLVGIGWWMFFSDTGLVHTLSTDASVFRVVVIFLLISVLFSVNRRKEGH